MTNIIEVSFGGGSIAYVKVDIAYFYNNGIIFKPTDIELPTSYQVHWADSPDKATTLETIGTAEGAPIPDDLWGRSRVIYGWIYLHPTENSGVTAYEVRIYKNVRAGLPDGTEPTPAEQSTIDQLISALNSAVEQAEDAQEAIENMSVSATTLAEGESATVTKSEQDGVVHLAFGIPKGATGDDGYSPTANVSKTGKVATITITDKNGTTSAQVSDGEDGTDGIDGISPSVSVTDITGGHRVVITDKDGAKSFDVEDGATGATPNLTIGTVETLEPTESATATITGTPENPVLNLGIPQGEQGEVTLDEFYKAFPTDTASGAIASFSDGADDLPLKSLVVDINPIQDLSNGDPSPENICPISGWTQVDVNHSDADMTNPTTLTINLGQTVYGGKLDVLSGELVIDRAMVDLGTLTWTKSATTGGTNDRWICNAPNDAAVTPTSSNKANFVCENYATLTANDTWFKRSTGISALNRSIYIYDPNTLDMTSAEFKSAMNGVMLCYELATPLTIQLDAHAINSLYGVNNIWADSGDTTAEYRADTKLFIERLTAPDSEDMVADTNITSGQYFMVGNSLYKATANIANGSAIVVGTNCTRKSLSEALNEINA